MGDTATFSRVVREDETVSRLFDDAALLARMPDVFATAYMVGLMEWACCEQIAPYYEDGECSLGVRVDISHVAATPPGMTVTVTSRVAELDGRFIRFDVSLSDGMDLIGEGRHQRALVQTARFQAKADAKARAAGVAG
ncbi:MAG: thioesterase family protein [Rhodobacteraceae bacterium]|nr:thioesterase family protein [Paracoccaceae bacterium]